MNKKIIEACEGLEQGENGLKESDLLLRDEIINHKIDYLCDVVGSLARLIVDLQYKNPKKAADSFNETAKKAYDESTKGIVLAINEYKERRDSE